MLHHSDVVAARPMLCNEPVLEHVPVYMLHKQWLSILASILLDIVSDPKIGGDIRHTVEADGDRLGNLHVYRQGPGHLDAIVSVNTERARYASYYRARLARFPRLSHVTARSCARLIRPSQQSVCFNALWQLRNGPRPNSGDIVHAPLHFDNAAGHALRSRAINSRYCNCYFDCDCFADTGDRGRNDGGFSPPPGRLSS